MAPPIAAYLIERAHEVKVPTKSSLAQNGIILEAWGQGFNVGALVILILLVCCNIKRGVLLHKLILIEVTMLLRQSWQ